MIYYLLPVALGLIFVLGLGYRGWPDARSRALSALRRAPNVAIAEIEDGRWAKITGVVSALGPPMTSPFSDQPCIGFRLLVESVKPGLAPGVLAQEECGAFSIEDDTGKVYVDGPCLFGLDAEADWAIVPPDRRRYVEDALAKAGLPIAGTLYGLGYAFREAVLKPGDRVSVLGLVSFEPDPTEPAAGFRSPSIRAHLRGSKEEPVVVAEPR